MIERGEGKIVNVASIAGLVGGHPDYMQTMATTPARAP
jgi:gluconate 5-dehydrogenase